MNLQKILFILISILVATVIVSIRNQSRSRTSPTPHHASPSALPSAQASSASLLPPASPLSNFIQTFGPGLKAEYSSSGRVSSIRGRAGQSAPAAAGFDPGESQDGVARAREILESAAPFMGIDLSTLGPPVARAGEVSVQVFFKQGFEGALVMPYGNITVDLGSKGELIAIDSDYIPELRSENARSLGPEAARPPAAPGAQVLGGNAVFFVPQPAIGVGRHAYEYNVDGRQVLVDAASGKILFERDKRRF